MERFKTIVLVAGISFFGFAFVAMGLSAYAIAGREKVLTVEELLERDGVLEEFYDLERRFPEAFAEAFGHPSTEAEWKAAQAKALRTGRDTYIAEACWHCHSQYVRPVSNEDVRFGPVSRSSEYQNELQVPVLFGTRRVGPDLTREAKVRSNDWHAAHFWDPRSTSPVSVMPRYPWFFDAPRAPDRAPQPNFRGLSLIAYVQWLGSWTRNKDWSFSEPN
jgi:hypothetical protein